MRYLRSIYGGIILVMIGLLIISGSTAQASYLDPGSASYLFQLAIAGFIGVLYTLRQYLGRLKTFGKGKPSAHQATDETQ